MSCLFYSSYTTVNYLLRFIMLLTIWSYIGVKHLCNHLRCVSCTVFPQSLLFFFFLEVNKTKITQLVMLPRNLDL